MVVNVVQVATYSQSKQMLTPLSCMRFFTKSNGSSTTTAAIILEKCQVFQYKHRQYAIGGLNFHAAVPAKANFKTVGMGTGLASLALAALGIGPDEKRHYVRSGAIMMSTSAI